MVLLTLKRDFSQHKTPDHSGFVLVCALGKSYIFGDFSSLKANVIIIN